MSDKQNEVTEKFYEQKLQEVELRLAAKEVEIRDFKTEYKTTE